MVLSAGFLLLATLKATETIRTLISCIELRIIQPRSCNQMISDLVRLLKWVAGTQECLIERNLVYLLRSN